MARYKVIDTSPRFLAVDLEKQLLAGSFEHAMRSAHKARSSSIGASMIASYAVR